MLLPSIADSLTPATGGFATSVWRVDVERRAFALRVFRVDQEAVLQREVAVMRAAAHTLPVPRVHAIGVYDGRPALLLDWCAGKPIISQPWLAVTFGRMHHRLHAVRAPAALRDTWIDWPGPRTWPLSPDFRTLDCCPIGCCTSIFIR